MVSNVCDVCIRISGISGGGKSLKVLVTGGRGMIGRVIVSLLVKEHYRVRVLSRTLPLKNESMPYEYFQGDILNKAQMEEAVLGCSAVFHCAAEIKDERKMQLT